MFELLVCLNLVHQRSSFWLCWSRSTAEFNHRLLYTSKWSPYIQVLTVCHTQLFELITSSFVSEWHLSLWNRRLAVSDGGPLILKTDRHRGVLGWRGGRGPRRGHTQDRTAFQIPAVVTADECMALRWCRPLMGFKVTHISVNEYFQFGYKKKPEWKCREF